MHETRSDVIAAIAGSTVLVLATLLPLMRLARAKHLLPRWVRDLPATSRAAAVSTVLTATAVLFLLTAPSEASRA
jgi:hypothetical protein